MNQAICDKLFIVEEGVVIGSDIQPPFLQLLDADLDAWLERESQMAPDEALALIAPVAVSYEDKVGRE